MEIKHSFRLAWLDDIKGFAMLCVVIQHAFLNPPWGRYLFLGSVPIFFVAAGFTTTSMTSEQIARKSKRLLVPYFVSAVGLGLIALGATCWKNGSGADFGHRILGFPVSFFNGQFGSHGMASLAAYVLLAVTEFVLLARLLNNTHGGKLFFVPFRALGKNSLVFLCFQLFIINACELALGNSPGSNISVGLIKSLVTIVFCLLAARLIFRLGKTVPFFKLLG